MTMSVVYCLHGLTYTVVAARETQVRYSSDRKQVKSSHATTSFLTISLTLVLCLEPVKHALNIHGSHLWVTPNSVSCFSQLEVLECIWCVCSLCKSHGSDPAWLQIRGPLTWPLRILLQTPGRLAQGLKAHIWIFLLGHTCFHGQQILLALSFLGPFFCVLDLGLGLNLSSLNGEAGDWVEM